MPEPRFYCYIVRRKSTGQYYIGKRTCYCDPKLDISYMGSGVVIENMIKHVGLQDFDKEILGEYPTNEECCQAEIQFLAGKFAVDRMCLNRTAGGEGVVGFKMNESSKRKMREAKLGRNLSEEHKLKISISVSNVQQSDPVAQSARVMKSWESRDKSTVSETFKKIHSEPVVKRGFKVRGWNNNAEQWLVADLLYDYWKPVNCSYKKLASIFGVNATENLINKFRSGWVPLEDQDWIDWRNNYAKEQIKG